ncbi:MAG: glycine cleavage system aminomethyltransferase GcvT [Thermoplasmatales archaeon]|nr:glycine cleavage system aminomethyltransferase GcvT [Thermoplasmatales archaeon]
MKTALYELHKELGATFTNFMGYEMPLKYSSVNEEHINVRRKVGIFDVSHMGKIFLKGKDIKSFISKITVERGEKISEDKGAYTLLLDENGHIIDDELFFNLGNEHLFIPNSGMQKKIIEWMEKNNEEGIDIEDANENYSILALQGPLSQETLQEIISPFSLPLFGCIELKKEQFKIDFDGRCILSRSGYTGEKGYEMYISPAEEAEKIFRALLQKGNKYGIMPIGLAARDTLRLEKGFMFASNEFSGGRNPIEAGLEWCIDWEHEFIGKNALIEFKKREEYERIAFLECIGPGIPRHGEHIFKENEKIGIVTSGGFSPCLKKGIAMGYIRKSFITIGNEVEIIGRKNIRAKIVKPPFVGKDAC